MEQIKLVYVEQIPGPVSLTRPTSLFLHENLLKIELKMETSNIPPWLRHNYQLQEEFILQA